MAFYAPYAFEVGQVVRKPFMLVEHVIDFTIREKPQAALVHVAVETYLVVILDGGSQVFRVTDADMVGMRVMAHPAVEFLVVLLEMDAGLVFFIDAFKIVLCEIFISGMTIHAHSQWFEPELVWMGKGIVF
jgi:hypothetical protein